jgi:hypothetical protein
MVARAPRLIVLSRYPPCACFGKLGPHETGENDHVKQENERDCDTPPTDIPH